MTSKNNNIRIFSGATILALGLIFGTSMTFAMDDMMGKMPDPAQTDTMQNDPNDTSDTTAGNHNHQKMMRDHEKMMKDHKMMMKKDSRAQVGKIKKKSMPMNDPSVPATKPDSSTPASDMEDM